MVNVHDHDVFTSIFIMTWEDIGLFYSRIFKLVLMFYGTMLKSSMTTCQINVSGPMGLSFEKNRFVLVSF